ncbi:hypothetical protein HY339_02445 [Candidatus Gottesmanbacteria bacterium]|nr:hypothetical protein [Candidatus Gottesmanbacteria bacterium]
MHRILAQLTNPVIPPIIGEGAIEKGGTAVGLILSRVISGIFLLAFIIAFFYLITGAMYWITSAGDKTKLEEARNRITHSIIGIIVVAATWAIMVLTGQFLGLDFENLPIPTISSPSTGGAPAPSSGGGGGGKPATGGYNEM